MRQSIRHRLPRISRDVAWLQHWPCSRWSPRCSWGRWSRLARSTGRSCCRCWCRRSHWRCDTTLIDIGAIGAEVCRPGRVGHRRARNIQPGQRRPGLCLISYQPESLIV
jgi:hypothetical protein